MSTLDRLLAAVGAANVLDRAATAAEGADEARHGLSVLDAFSETMDGCDNANSVAPSIDLDLALIDVPLTPGEVAAIPSASLYVGDPAAASTRAREASEPRSPTPSAVRQVSHITRQTRHRMVAMRDADRVCAHCGARSGEGPAPVGWDFHAVQGRAELAATCSPACRALLGLAERRR